MSIRQRLEKLIGVVTGSVTSMSGNGVSNARRESNVWLQRVCSGIPGRVLSIGSGDDSDGEGSKYRNYFTEALSYTTSEVSSGFDSDLLLDIRSMPEIADGYFDCVYCSGVLEHVDDFQAGVAEITRILADGGVLLLGLPFRQAIHLAPNDYWRFTEFGIRHLLRDDYVIKELTPVDAVGGAEFPAAYWTKAIKMQKEDEHRAQSTALPGAGAVPE